MVAPGMPPPNVGDTASFVTDVLYTNVGGVVTHVQTGAQEMLNDSSMATCVQDNAISGTVVNVRVKGVASTTIDWTAVVQVNYV